MQLPGQLPTKKAFLQKQIPTLAGLAVLVIALVAGLLMFSTGTGVFAPRATPQTTPKQVKITNVGDKAFTVSFYTDEATAGFVKYGVDEADLKTQASDDRDQLAGSVGKYTLHHVTVKSLKPNTSYFFTIGTGSGSSFDNEGKAFSVKTAVDPGTPPPVAKTVYGSVMTAGGTPAEGSVVYLVAEGGAELSALVKSSGSWAISLANARTADGSAYAEITDDTALTVFVQGSPLTQTVRTTSQVKDAQPLADLSLGTGGGTAATVPKEEESTDETASESAEVATGSATATKSASLTDLVEATESTSSGAASTSATKSATTTTAASSSATASPSAVLNLTQLASTPITTVESPKVVGKAAPRVQVKIEIHSETEITQTVTADANGNFELDTSQFQDLEPGEHTVTYSYIDPTTGQEVTKTHTFTVADPNATKQLALAPLGAGTPTAAPTSSKTGTQSAFGSGNPYPITSPTKAVDTSTRSAVVSTTSGTYTSGSVGATIALISGGLFLMLLGWWSWWLAGQVREE
jgi:hypothetical protein